MNHAKMITLIPLLLLGVATQNCGAAPEDAQGLLSPAEESSRPRIEELEAEQQIELVKELKTITDEHQNSVTLLVASESSQVVADFLSGNDISLEMVDASAQQPEPAEIDPSLDEEVFQERPHPRRLLLEVVSRSFGPETKAFTLKFRGKAKSPPTLPGPQSFSETYESALFIEGFVLDYVGLTCGTCGFSSITAKHYSRACGLCSYKIHASKTLSPGQSWQSCNDARRTKVVISGILPRDYYNFNFTFWNCS